MKVKEVMTDLVRTCGADSNLAAAAMSMWDGDCGIIPVVDRSREQVIGLITDRDICIAAAMKGRPLSEIRVGEVISGKVYSCAPDDDVESALTTMIRHQVRRSPVIDAQGKLAGILSLNDVIRSAGSGVDPVKQEAVIAALQEICKHRGYQAVDEQC
jgi:CBS domain-containing protein